VEEKASGVAREARRGNCHRLGSVPRLRRWEHPDGIHALRRWEHPEGMREDGLRRWDDPEVCLHRWDDLEADGEEWDRPCGRGRCRRNGSGQVQVQVRGKGACIVEDNMQPETVATRRGCATGMASSSPPWAASASQVDGDSNPDRGRIQMRICDACSAADGDIAGRTAE
jgi:hypothetical protein